MLDKHAPPLVRRAVTQRHSRGFAGRFHDAVLGQSCPQFAFRILVEADEPRPREPVLENEADRLGPRSAGRHGGDAAIERVDELGLEELKRVAIDDVKGRVRATGRAPGERGWRCGDRFTVGISWYDFDCAPLIGRSRYQVHPRSAQTRAVAASGATDEFAFTILFDAPPCNTHRSLMPGKLPRWRAAMASRRENIHFYGILSVCGLVVLGASVPRAPTPSSESVRYATPADFDAPKTEGQMFAIDFVMGEIKSGDKPRMVAGCRMLITMSRKNVERFENGTANASEADLVRQFMPMRDACQAMIQKFG